MIDISATPSSEHDLVEIEPAGFVSGGQRVDCISVNINFGIIEQFSEGLYSSPNKTFEELVTNSYDAGATQVWVQIPDRLDEPDAVVAVIDNGESMDIQGLRELWLIGESTKRDRQVNPLGRKPVGKFGIGKLATYVLANELTYVCKRGPKYLASTMDYRRVRGKLAEIGNVLLGVVELSADDAKQTLLEAIGDIESVELLFAPEAPENWTAALMSSLKDRGQRLERGRIRWILSVALPLNPQFNLCLNGSEVQSSKIAGSRIWTFNVGSGDIEKSTAFAECASSDGVRLPNAGLVTGTAEMYDLPLPRGKAEDLGRSHGFFVKIRERLVNLNDAEFGINVELHHGVFTRFHMEVNADGLDEGITATRESIKDSQALSELRQYLLSVFNAARSARVEKEEAHPRTLSASERIAHPPQALSQGPLRRAIRRAREDGGKDRLLAELVVGIDDLENGTSQNDEPANLLEGIAIEQRGVHERIASYDVPRRMIVMNRDHPFIENYIDENAAVEPLQLIAATEFFTATYLLDEATPTGIVRDVLDRRDAYLRALVTIYPHSAPRVARQLRDAVHTEKELEDAVADAMRFLGFRVQRKSGPGRTDVLAIAHLGRYGDQESRSYRVVCDAKSTSRDAVIKADKVNLGPLRKHQRKEAAQYIMVVAPGFEGADSNDSSIAEYCTDGGITPITADDLARIVEFYPTRLTSPSTLEALFRECHTPLETRAHVDEMAQTGARRPQPPVDLLIGIIDDLSEAKAPVAINGLPNLLLQRSGGQCDCSLGDVRAMIDGLRALAPTGIWSDSEWVALQTSPENIRAEIHSNVDALGDSSVIEAREAFGVES